MKHSPPNAPNKKTLWERDSHTRISTEVVFLEIVPFLGRGDIHLHSNAYPLMGNNFDMEIPASLTIQDYSYRT